MPDKNFATSIQLILQASMAGKPHHEAVLTLGATPQYLLDIGFANLPLQIKAKTIDKAHFTHGITRGVLERLSDILNSPKALYDSDTQPGSAVVVTYEIKAGCPILVPIHRDKAVGRATVNEVASVYIKQANIEQRWKAKGLLRWEK